MNCFVPSCLQSLIASRVDLGAEIGSGCTSARKVAGEYWLDERAEDNLGATSLGKSKPEDSNEFEGEIEGEPVNSIDGTLKYSEEREYNPVRKPLGIVAFADAKQRFERIVTRNHETSKVSQELTADVEEDEEKVECDQSEEDVDFWEASLLLEVVQSLILRKLLIN